jgi:hypothetical protein
MRDSVESAAAALRRLSQALWNRFLDTLREPWAAVRTLRGLVRTAPLTSVGLLVLLATIVATAYLSQSGQHLLSLSAELWEGNAIAVPAAALCFSLGAVSLGWALVLVGAASASLPLYVLSASYASFYALSPGLGVAGSIWFVLIPLWVLMLGACCRSPLQWRWRILLLGWLSVVTAWITYPSLGLTRLVPGTAGRVLLLLLYLVLVAGPWARRRPRIRPGPALGLTWLLLATFYTYALYRSPPGDVLADTFVAFYYLLGLLSLFWIWLGLDLFSGAQSTAWWLADTLRSVLSQRVLAPVLFSLGTLAPLLPTCLCTDPAWA